MGMLWSAWMQHSFLQQVVLYLFPFFLHQLFSWTDIFETKLLCFNFYIYIYLFLALKKIFAVTGTLKSNSPSHQTQETEQLSKAGARLGQLAELSQCCSKGGMFLPACGCLGKLSVRLPMRDLFQGLLQFCFTVLILQTSSGVFHSYLDRIQTSSLSEIKWKHHPLPQTIFLLTFI